MCFHKLPLVSDSLPPKNHQGTRALTPSTTGAPAARCGHCSDKYQGTRAPTSTTTGGLALALLHLPPYKHHGTRAPTTTTAGAVALALRPAIGALRLPAPRQSPRDASADPIYHSRPGPLAAACDWLPATPCPPTITKGRGR